MNILKELDELIILQLHMQTFQLLKNYNKKMKNHPAIRYEEYYLPHWSLSNGLLDGWANILFSDNQLYQYMDKNNFLRNVHYLITYPYINFYGGLTNIIISS